MLLSWIEYMNTNNFKNQVINIIFKNLAIIAKDISYLYLNTQNKSIKNNKEKEIESNNV